MSQSQPERPDRETQLDDREETQTQAAAAQATIQEALAKNDREQFLERFREVDIPGVDGQRIQEELAPEFAGIFAIANEDADDYRRHKWLNRNKKERVRAARNPGRLCRGPFLELARGTNNRREDEETLTKREKRILGDAMEAKTAMHSLGKGARGLKAVSEVTAVTEHRRQTEPDDDSSSGGIISRIFS